MFRAVSVGEKKQMPVKSTWEYYFPSCKTGQWPILQYIPHIVSIKPLYDEMVLKCLIYLFNSQRYYLEQF